MKAFVSYSVSDSNLQILTLLSSKLKEKSFQLNTSQNFYKQLLDYGTMNEINSSQLFVGLITGSGIERNRVLEEWQYANQNNIPNVLLIEDSVPVGPNFQGNFVRFNRHDPKPAINEINNRMTAKPQVPNSNANEILPWVLGGAALIAILAFLNSKE